MSNTKRIVPPVKGKRPDFKEMRRKRQRQQRVIIGLGIVGVVLVLALLIAVPTLQDAFAPVGEIVQITPVARPQASGTSAGDPNAPVRVDVWEDFQCPGCQFYSQTIEPLIMQNYVETGKVYYTFHVHPFIDDHPSVAVKESDMAANASLCAAEQGFFWEYHDMLFANWNGENEGAFSSKRLIAFAEELSLGMEAFKACTREKRYEAEANASQADGVAKGVQSTPTIFVNDQKVISSRGDGYIAPYQEIAQLIETALGTSTP